MLAACYVCCMYSNFTVKKAVLTGGQKFHSLACNNEWNLERTSNYRTSALGRITQGSYITYHSLMFFIAYKGQVCVFAGWVEIVSHSSCRTSAILKYFCPLVDLIPLIAYIQMHFRLLIPSKQQYKPWSYGTWRNNLIWVHIYPDFL